MLKVYFLLKKEGISKLSISTFDEKSITSEFDDMEETVGSA